MLRKDLKIGDIFGHGGAPYYIVTTDKGRFECFYFQKNTSGVTWTSADAEVNVIDLQTALKWAKIEEPAEWMLKYLQPQFEYEYVDGF